MGEEFGLDMEDNFLHTLLRCIDDSPPSSFLPIPSGKSLLTRVPDTSAFTTSGTMAILKLASSSSPSPSERLLLSSHLQNPAGSCLLQKTSYPVLVLLLLCVPIFRFRGSWPLYVIAITHLFC
jgi:hypothetical protein